MDGQVIQDRTDNMQNGWGDRTFTMDLLEYGVAFCNIHNIVSDLNHFYWGMGFFPEDSPDFYLNQSLKR